ncbi:MAG: nitroreductase family protein [Oscillospiraceae bacterium]|nr:nitroreductase family protein [Oscillospiraceae bacterium]
MNKVIDVIMSRRSVREYTQEQVDEELLTAVIEAGRCAPSGGNAQLTHFIVIQNPDVLSELIRISKIEFAKIIPDENTYASLRSTIEHAHMPDFHFNYMWWAPTLIVTAHKKGHTNAMADSVCAIENMTIAAESLGLGSCYINPPHWLDDSEGFREFMYTIGLGKDETVTASLALGYPAEKSPKQPPERKGNPVTYV